MISNVMYLGFRVKCDLNMFPDLDVKCETYVSHTACMRNDVPSGLLYQQICSILIIYTAHQIKQTQREGKRIQTLFRGAFKAIQMKSMMYALYSVECVSCLNWLNALPYLPNLSFSHFITKCKGYVNDAMSFRTKGAVVCG